MTRIHVMIANSLSKLMLLLFAVVETEVVGTRRQLGGGWWEVVGTMGQSCAPYCCCLHDVGEING